MSSFFIVLVLLRLLLALSVEARTCDSQDKAALLSLQASFISGPWDPSLTATLDCCSWSGIITLELPQVTPHDEENNELPRSTCQLNALEKLVISGTSPVFKPFTGVIPRCIGKSLKSLRHLDLSLNSFVGKITPELGLLSKLEYLHLGDNNFGGGIPTEICKLKSLTYFNLERLYTPRSSHSQGALPECITSLSKLQYLNLGFNSFTGSLPATIGDFVSLEELNLYGNDFTGSVPSSIGRLSRLRKLSINSPRITGPLPSSFANLAALQELELSDLSLHGPLPDFTSFKDIKILRLFNCSFSGTLPARFSKGKLHKLVEINLQMNAISGDIPASFPIGMPNVEQMVLSENLLTGAVPSAFSSLRKLTFFQISNNKLSGHIPEFLGEMNSDLILDASNNQLIGTFPV